MEKEKIDNVVNYLIEILKKKLGMRLESINLIGSYALGKVSLDRPDVNLILFFKGWATAEDYIEFGKILYEVVNKFKDEFSVRLEFRPFRFVYPIVRGKLELFINPLLLNTAEKDRNFNLDPQFLDGAKATRKVVYGTDVLGDMEFEITKENVRKGITFLFPMIKIQLDRAPLVYDINKDPDLLFNEALAQGKLMSYHAVEIAMSDEDLKEKKYAELIADKAKLLQFIKERYDEDTANALDTILKARENYSAWKNDKNKAIDVYKAAHVIWQKTWMKTVKG